MNKRLDVKGGLMIVVGVQRSLFSPLYRRALRIACRTRGPVRQGRSRTVPGGLTVASLQQRLRRLTADPDAVLYMVHNHPSLKAAWSVLFVLESLALELQLFDASDPWLAELLWRLNSDPSPRNVCLIAVDAWDTQMRKIEQRDSQHGQY